MALVASPVEAIADDGCGKRDPKTLETLCGDQDAVDNLPTGTLYEIYIAYDWERDSGDTVTVTLDYNRGHATGLRVLAWTPCREPLGYSVDWPESKSSVRFGRAGSEDVMGYLTVSADSSAFLQARANMASAMVGFGDMPGIEGWCAVYDCFGCRYCCFPSPYCRALWNVGDWIECTISYRVVGDCTACMVPVRPSTWGTIKARH